MRDSLPPPYTFMRKNRSFQRTFCYHLRKYLRYLSSNARNIANICTYNDTMICGARKTVNIYNIFSAMLEICKYLRKFLHTKTNYDMHCVKNRKYLRYFKRNPRNTVNNWANIYTQKNTIICIAQ